MERDVARLRALNQELYEQCVLQDTGSSNSVKLDKDMRPYNADTVAYSIRYLISFKSIFKYTNYFTHNRENVTGCHLAAMTELPLVEKVRKVQLERWNKLLQEMEEIKVARLSSRET